MRGPRYVVKRGKTALLSAEEARKLLDSIDTAPLIGLPHARALIGAWSLVSPGSAPRS